MRSFKPLLCCALILLLAAACGLKGPLYLPQAEPPPSQDEKETSAEQRDKEAA